MIAAATGEWSTRPHFVSSCKKHCLLERRRVGALLSAKMLLAANNSEQNTTWHQLCVLNYSAGFDSLYLIEPLCLCLYFSVCVLTDQNIAVQALT